MAPKKDMNSLTIPISNLRTWQARNWVKYDNVSSDTLLKIHYDQVLIINDNIILESISCNGKLKGFNKDNNLILIIGSTTNEIRKIKFQIKDKVSLCLQELGLRFPLVNYNKSELNPAPVRYRNIAEVLKKALEENDQLFTLQTPSTYGSFVKMCLLDPLFPQLVLQTQDFINKEIVGINN